MKYKRVLWQDGDLVIVIDALTAADAILTDRPDGDHLPLCVQLQRRVACSTNLAQTWLAQQDRPSTCSAVNCGRLLKLSTGGTLGLTSGAAAVAHRGVLSIAPFLTCTALVETGWLKLLPFTGIGQDRTPCAH